MNDFYFALGGAATICIIATVVGLVESYTKCNHKWGDWNFREDSACFIQSRKCVKCQYMELQQIRKLTNAPENL